MNYSILAAAALFTVLLPYTACAEIKSAFLPAVPESWNMTIDGKTVIYSAPVAKKGEKPATVVKFTYTRATKGRDAAAVMDEYIRVHQCSPKTEQGKGFYTTSCATVSTDAVVVGEPDNMYTLEVVGLYNQASTNLINSYLNEIINGKRTFEDRDIGEKVIKKKPYVVPAAPASGEGSAEEVKGEAE